MLMTALKYQASWLVHTLRRRRSPLCRTVDRIAAATSTLVLAVAVIAMAAAVPFGVLMHKNLAQRAARTAATTHPVTAVLTTDASVGVGTTDASQTYPEGVAVAQWAASNGLRSAAINVPLTSTRGQSLTIWTDASGSMTAAPPSPASVIWTALFSAAGLLLTVLLCCTGLIAGTQQLARRYALRRWGREWEVMQRWGSLRQ